MDKTYGSPQDAVDDIGDGASLAVGGFGLCGNPMQLIDAIHAKGVIHRRVSTLPVGCDMSGCSMGPSGFHT